MAITIGEEELQVWDAHTHLGRRPVPLGHGISEYVASHLVESLDEAGIDRAVAFPLGAPDGDYGPANSLIAQEIAKAPDRIVGFCRLNPNLGTDYAWKELERCLAGEGLRGIKLHPEIEFFDPNDRELMEPIYESAKKYSVPILFHTGMSSKAAPSVIADVARLYPDVPVILGHMGVSEYAKQAIAVATQYDNIFLETSVVGWMPIFIEAFRRAGPSKVLYGSDHPYNSLGMELSKIAQHVAAEVSLTPKQLEAVLSGNLRGLLARS